MRYLEGGGKRAIWVVHRRGGKDLTALHQTCRMAHRRPGIYWHVFPTFAQGRKSVWEGFTKDGRRILDMAFPAELRKSSNQSEMKIEFKNGSLWRLIGSDKIEVVGAGPFGVVFSEFAVARPNTWELIRPMLRENGGWAAFITTPRGRNHAWELYKQAEPESGWFRDVKTVRDTSQVFESSRKPGLMLTPEQMMEEERAEGMPEALIRQEYLCDWSAALVGSVWGDQIETTDRDGRLAAFDHPSDGVFTSWDLGFTDSTAIWVWRLNADGGLDFIDHYEAHGQKIPHYVGWLNSRGYSYAMHWIPHDGAADTLASMSSSEDQLRLAFPGKIQIGPKLSLVDGIQAGRWLLERKCRFHARCEKGVDALRNYHYGWDEDTKTFDKKPLHDWSSHTADAFRYAAVVAKVTQLLGRKHEEPRKPKYGATEIVVQDGKAYIPRPLDDLFAEHGKQPGRRRI